MGSDKSINRRSSCRSIAHVFPEEISAVIERVPPLYYWFFIATGVLPQHAVAWRTTYSVYSSVFIPLSWFIGVLASFVPLCLHESNSKGTAFMMRAGLYSFWAVCVEPMVWFVWRRQVSGGVTMALIKEMSGCGFPWRDHRWSVYLTLCLTFAFACSGLRGWYEFWEPLGPSFGGAFWLPHLATAMAVPSDSIAT